jgi:flagellar hook capping protein FlgD
MRDEWSSLTVLIVLVSVVVGSPGGVRPAGASWPVFGRAICTAPNSQTHCAITGDGVGGAIIAWQDHRNAKVNIFAQHVLASGNVDPSWPENGQAMVADTSFDGPAGGNFFPLAVSDLNGGSIVAWVDLRAATIDQLDIFTQHILASGTVDARWPANGTRLASALGLQASIAMISDGAGGAIVTWVDDRAGVGERDVYAQHVLVTGVVDSRWPVNGVALCTAPKRQEFPAIVGDDAGGAIIAWDDGRSSASGLDVYAQHVLGSGLVDPAWPLNGRALCNALGFQGRVTITSDCARGGIVAWTDARIAGTDHIFAQHVLASGAIDPVWPANGRGISNAAVLESRPLAVSDGVGGAIVTWQGFTLHLNMYVQHVRATGVVDPGWPAAGRALSNRTRLQTHADIAVDGAGGAVVAWADSFDIVAQHVLSSGALDPAYPDTGRALCYLPSQQGEPHLIGTGDGGAIAAQTTGVPGPGPGPVIQFLRASPNPARDAITLRFTLSSAASVKVVVLDLAGRRVREFPAETQSSGEHSMKWDLRDDRGEPVGSGIFFARIEAGGRAFNQKLVSLN